jgi:L-ascorbate metabolism protein UlaG (beta-lactamase superfamily)
MGRGQEEINIFLDPFDKETGLRPPQGQSDLALVSHQHHDHNNVQSLKGNPTVIDIPGEYSFRGISIIGIPSYHDVEKKIGNTIFVLEAEEMRLCHLGDLGVELEQKELELINSVDILMVPIGGKYTLNYKKAIDLIKKIEPAIIIPMHYKINGSTIDIDNEKKFCNEIGNCSRERVSKINLKKKDLEEKVMETIVMNPD